VNLCEKSRAERAVASAGVGPETETETEREKERETKTETDFETIVSEFKFDSGCSISHSYISIYVSAFVALLHSSVMCHNGTSSIVTSMRTVRSLFSSLLGFSTKWSLVSGAILCHNNKCQLLSLTTAKKLRIYI